MQNPSSSLSGAGDYLIELAKYLGSGGVIGFLTWWLTSRRKVKPEIRILDATAEKVMAETRRLDSETLNDAYDRIDQLYSIADAQRTQIQQLSISNDKKLIELEMMEDQVKWLNAVLHVANIKLSDYDHLRQKRQLK